MQRTEKYFEQDAFRTGCESVILAAEPDEKTGGGRIALDGTVFYPEGGGQPADRGTLTLPDGTPPFQLLFLAVGRSDNVCGNVTYELDNYMNQQGMKHLFYDTTGGHQNVVWQNALYNFGKRLFRVGS